MCVFCLECHQLVRWPKRCVPLSVLVANDVFGENRHVSIRDVMSFFGIVFVIWFFSRLP